MNNLNKVLKGIVESLKLYISQSIKDAIGTGTLETSSKTLIGSINEVNTQCKDIAKQTIIEGNKIYLAKSDGTKLGEGTDLPINSNSVITLTQEQYDELIANGKITINGTEHIYNENNIYNISNPTKIQLYDSNGASYFIEIKDGKLSLSEPVGTSEIIISTTFLKLIEGGSNYFYVKLNEQPKGKQIINISASSEYVTISPSTVEFTPDNWSIDNKITISAINDNNQDNDNYIITLSSLNVESKNININVVDKNSNDIITLYDEGTVPNGQLSLTSCTDNGTYLQFVKSASSKIDITGYPLSLKKYDEVHIVFGKIDSIGEGTSSYSFKISNDFVCKLSNNSFLTELTLYSNFNETGITDVCFSLQNDITEFNFELSSYFAVAKVHKIYIIRGE
jgi:hypothetical protein|nr:MAG TPA: hypothetical protein [Caudoviricetes sp.]